MRIVYFYQYFSTPQGSWGTRVFEFAKKWVEEGHDVTVVTSIYSKSDIKASKFIEEQEHDGIKVKVLNILIDNKQSTAWRIYTFVMYAILSSWYALVLPADVVVASSGPITAGIPGIFAWLRGRKLVFEVRDLWPGGAIELGLIKSRFIQRLAYAFERLCYRCADLVVTLSPGMQTNLAQRVGVRHSISVPNAANIELFGTRQPTHHLPAFYATHKVAIYTGNIGKVNNSELLLKAALALKQRGAHQIKILLVGDGQLREQLQQQAKDLDLDNFVILRLMPKDQLVSLVQNSFVSLVPLKGTPILDTSSPNKLFESFAAGVPVIQNTKGWIKDLLAKHHCGYTIDADNEEELADLLIQLSASPDELQRMGINAVSLARREFDKDVLSERMLQALITVHHGKRGKQNQHLFAMQSGLPEPNGQLPTPLPHSHLVRFVIDWYTPSSHATSLRMRPWIDAIRSAGGFEVIIHTDKRSEREDGVVPNFIKTPDNRSNALPRLVRELLLGIELFFTLLFARKSTVVISSPPFLAGAMAALACIISRKPYFFDVRDLYPLVYANSGMIKRNGILYKVLLYLSKLCYSRAAATVTVSNMLVDYIKVISPTTKLVLVKNGFKKSLFFPCNEKYEVFTLVFHGNIGQFQSPELLLAVCAELDKRGEDYRCIVIGSGSKQELVEKSGSKRISYLGRLSNEELASIIRKCHVGLSFRTDDEVSWRSIPVRVTEYIGVGIPCILTPASEGGRLIEDNKVGRCFNNDQLTEIVDFIAELKNNSECYQQYVENALKVRDRFSREAGASLFLQEIMNFYTNKRT